MDAVEQVQQEFLTIYLIRLRSNVIPVYSHVFYKFQNDYDVFRRDVYRVAVSNEYEVS